MRVTNVGDGNGSGVPLFPGPSCTATTQRTMLSEVTFRELLLFLLPVSFNASRVHEIKPGLRLARPQSRHQVPRFAEATRKNRAAYSSAISSAGPSFCRRCAAIC